MKVNIKCSTQSFQRNRPKNREKCDLNYIGARPTGLSISETTDLMGFSCRL